MELTNGDLAQFRLRKNRMILVRDIIPDTIVDILLAEEILNQEEYESIMYCNQTTAGKNRRLLDVIATKGPNGYNEFRQALSKEHLWLVEALDSTPWPAGESEEHKGGSLTNGTVSDRAIDRVVKNLLMSGSLVAWKFIARKLNISEDKINEIEFRSPRDIRTQIYEMLLYWKFTNGQQATQEKLCAVLLEEGRIATAEALRSGNYD